MTGTPGPAGYTVETASAGAQALLPGMSGWEVLRTLRDEPLNQAALVVVVSAARERARIQRWAQALLAKAGGGATLIEQLREHLLGTRSLQALARLNESEPVKETAPKLPSARAMMWERAEPEAEVRNMTHR